MASSLHPSNSPIWRDAETAAALVAIDPQGLGGVVVRAPVGPVRDRWLEVLRDLVRQDTPFLRVPSGIGEDRLLGGLDLTATLSARRPVLEKGLLAHADGGIVIVPMAERLAPVTASHIAAVLDSGTVRTERDGLAALTPTRFAVVALDEGETPDERTPSALEERLAIQVDLSSLSWRECASSGVLPRDVAAAREHLSAVRIGNDAIEACVAAAASLAIPSLRAPFLMLRAACASAALAGRREISEEDLMLAARLVLAPRARALPAAPPEESEPEQQSPEEPLDPPETHEEPNESPEDEQPASNEEPSLRDIILAAAEAVLPAHLLADAASGNAPRRSPGSHTGKSNAVRKTTQRGRPVGTRQGQPTRGARLSVIDTLRAAAPWQTLRALEEGQSLQGDAAAGSDHGSRVRLRREDFRVRRYLERSEALTIFVVDASGSTALNRLAEAKGAVERLLADCYVRRDSVALVLVRGRSASLALPPTRSLARAKRELAGLPGGGGTPLADGIAEALTLALLARRKGASPSIVLLTDGRANVARDGTTGREAAEADARAAARIARAEQVASILIDTSPRPAPFAAELAREMHARYVALPFADSRALAEIVSRQQSAAV